MALFRGSQALYEGLSVISRNLPKTSEKADHLAREDVVPNHADALMQASHRPENGDIPEQTIVQHLIECHLADIGEGVGQVGHFYACDEAILETSVVSHAIHPQSA